MRILVVDDVKYNGALVVLELQRMGHEVGLVLSGIEALREIANEKSSWDLVISDLMMPNMDGIALFKNVARLPKFKDNALHPIPPFLLLTASTDVDRLVEAKLAGFTDVLLKPLDRDRLEMAVKAIVPQQVTFERTLSQTLQSIRDMITQIQNRRDIDSAKTTVGYLEVMANDLREFVSDNDPDEDF